MERQTRTLLVGVAAGAVATALLFVPVGQNDQGHSETIIQKVSRAITHRWLRPGGGAVGTAASAKANKGGKLRSGDKAETPAPGAANHATLRGTVKNEISGAVEGARITIRGTAVAFTKSVKSDKDGTFTAPEIPPGTYDIIADHSSYTPLVRPAFTFGPAAEERIQFILPAGATLAGSVTDEKKKPIEGAKVRARRRSLEQLAAGAKVYLDDSTYRTNESAKDGKFGVDGVSMGDVVLEVSKPGYEKVTMSVLVDAKEKPKPVSVLLKKTGTLAGQVTDESGQPVADATVQLQRYKPFGSAAEELDPKAHQVKTNAEGKFEHKALFTEGFYDLRVDSPTFAPSVQQLVAVGTANLTVVLSKGGNITGTVSYIDRETTEASVRLQAMAVIKDTTMTAESRSDAKGNFAFDRLPFGNYRLSIVEPGHMAEPLQPVAVAKDKEAPPVAMEIFKAALATGRVFSADTDAAIAGAKVTIKALYGEGKQRQRTFSASTNQHGQFDFPVLPAGVHTAEAEAKGYVKTATGSSAQTFDLMPGERKGDLALRLYRGGTVEGVVRAKDGQTLGGAEVQLYVASTMPDARLDVRNLKTKADENGHFSIASIDVGERIQLYASAQMKGYAKSRSRIVDLTAEKPSASTEIILTQGGAISGKVTDENDIPVPRAEVKFVSHEFPRDPSKSETVAHTGPDGSFVLSACAPGGADLRVSRSGFVEQSRHVTVLAEQNRAGEDFKLLQGQGISGRVVTLEGDAIRNARVEAHGIEETPGRDTAMTDKDGYFTLSNLGRGKFNLKTTFKLTTPQGDQSYVFEARGVKSGTTGLEVDCDVNNSASAVVESDNDKRLNEFRVRFVSRGDTQPKQDFQFVVDRREKSAGGVLAIGKVPRGVYSLRVESDGYEPFTSDYVYIGPSRRTVMPRIRLKTAGGVVGTVLSSKTRRPVNNAQVRVYEEKREDQKKPRLVASGQTDYAGKFRISSVASGRYFVEFHHPNYESASVSPVSVKKREAADLGEQYLLPGGAVAGTVMDEFGTPVPGMTVSVSGLIPEKQVTTDNAGNFLLQGIRSGRWPIVVRGQLRTRQVYSFSHANVSADDTQSLDFKVELSASLAGAMTSGDSGGARSGSVFVHPYDENANILEDLHYDASVIAQQFRIDAVPPGQYFLWATGLGVGGSYKLWDEVQLQRGQNHKNLALGTGAVSGAVTGANGEPVSGVQTQLLPIVASGRIPQSIYNSLLTTTYSNASGQYSFLYLRAGTYQQLYLDPLRAAGGQWIAQPPLLLMQGQVSTGNNIHLGH